MKRVRAGAWKALTENKDMFDRETLSLDLQQLQDLCDNEHELIRGVLCLFRTSTRSKLVGLEFIIKDDDRQKLKELAHDLKGLCANVGANELARLSRQLEQAADHPDGALIRSIYAAIRDNFGRVEHFINAYTGSFGRVV